MSNSLLLLFALTAPMPRDLPRYLQLLPWTCSESNASDTNGVHIDVLAECTPQGQPQLAAFVQTVADAMGHAGHPPRMRLGEHGPHLSSIDGSGITSVSFARKGSVFRAWVSIQTAGDRADPLPILPAGVTLISTHSEDSGKKLLSFHMAAGSRQVQALLDVTFAALGAKRLSSLGTPDDGISGRLLWQERVGFYHLSNAGPHEALLTLYTEKR